MARQHPCQTVILCHTLNLNLFNFTDDAAIVHILFDSRAEYCRPCYSITAIIFVISTVVIAGHYYHCDTWVQAIS
jgi:hypothetical protein